MRKSGYLLIITTTILLLSFQNCSEKYKADGSSILPSETPIQTQAREQIACGIPAREDAVNYWQTWKNAANYQTWPGAVPALVGDQPQINVSTDGAWLLMQNKKFLALFRSPMGPSSPYAALVGLTDRRFGEDMIRVQKNVPPSSWFMCMGTNMTSPSQCTETGGRYITGSITKPSSCKISNSKSNQAPVDCNQNSTGDTVTIEWRNFDGNLVVQQIWRLTEEDGILQRASASGNAADGFGIVALRAPVVVGVGQDPVKQRMQIIAPMNNTGLIYDSNLNGSSSKVVGSTYPNGFNMQFFGYMDGDHGLYWGSEDPTFSPKDLNGNGPTGVANGITYQTYYAQNPGTQNSNINANWNVRLKPVCTDYGWSQIAQEYRNWIEKNNPMNLKPLAERSDLPNDFKDGILWFLSGTGRLKTGAEFQSHIDQAEAIAGDLKIGFHLYSWYQQDFDTGLGGQDGGFTLTPSFIPVVNAVKAKGNHVVPYINPMYADVSDIQNANIQNECVARIGKPCNSPLGTYSLNADALKINTRGSFTTSPFNLFPFYAPAGSSGSFLADMCPSTQKWKNKVQDMWTSVRQLSSNGIYLDSYGNNANGCWDPTHNHTLGASRELIDRGRELILSRRSANDGLYLASEFGAEPYLDVVDITFNYGDRKPYSIPLFQYIYHDIHPMAGPRASPLDSDQVFIYKQGMAFLAGDHLGLNIFQTINTAAKKNALINFQRARLKLVQYLAYGKMMSTISYDETQPTPAQVIMGDAPTTCTTACWCLDGNACTPRMQAKMDPIQGAYWWAKNEYAVIISNLDKNNAHSVSIKLLPQLIGAKAKLCSLDGDNCTDISAQVQNAGRSLFIEQMAPTEIRFIKFEKSI